MLQCAVEKGRFFFRAGFAGLRYPCRQIPQGLLSCLCARSRPFVFVAKPSRRGRSSRVAVKSLLGFGVSSRSLHVEWTDDSCLAFIAYV